MKTFYKTLLAVLFIFGTSSATATDLTVDQNISNPNGTTYFNTVTDAVAASVSGDRIFIEAGTYNENPIQIMGNKALTFIGNSPNRGVDLNITFLNGNDSLKVIDFINLAVYSVSNVAPLLSSYASKQTTNIIDCTVFLLWESYDNANLFDHAEYGGIMNVYQSTVSYYQSTFGEIINSTITNLKIMPADSSWTNLSADQILILGNTIENLNIRASIPFIIANNIIAAQPNMTYEDGTFIISQWDTNLENENLIANNYYGTGMFLSITHNPPSYNLTFTNNSVQQGAMYGCNGANNWGTYLSYQSLSGCIGGCQLTIDYSIPGYFEWSYNDMSFLGSTFGCTPSGVLDFVDIDFSGSTIDGGNPEHRFYDRDGTRNDIGTGGGMWSNANLQTWVDRPQIFHLDMPTDIYPGDTIQIKAKAYTRD